MSLDFCLHPFCDLGCSGCHLPCFVQVLQVLSTSARRSQKMWHVVCFTTATTTMLSFSGIVRRMRTNLQKLHTNMTTKQPRQQGHKRGEDRIQETHRCTRLSCKRQGSPTSKYYRYGERARITTRPQTKYAPSHGTHHHRSQSLLDTLITNQSSGTEVLARRLIGTCARM